MAQVSLEASRMIAFAKDDLTGAALVSLMRLSFAKQGLALPENALTVGPNQPHASLSSKEALAEWVLARHGPIALLKVGKSVPLMSFDPIGGALLAARDGRDLLTRWSRLERYVHNRHPIVLCEVAESAATLSHAGDPINPPSMAVDFVLAGVIAGLLTSVGCRELSLTMGDGAGVCTVIESGRVVELLHVEPRPTGLWRFAWAAGNSGARPATALFGSPDARLGRLTREAIARIEADLVAAPDLTSLAKELGQSPRTLQRRLAEDGLSLQSIRRAAQVRRASAMLIEMAASLSAIGFACGFTDQPHFARAFAKAAGMSPKEFREAARPGAMQRDAGSASQFLA